MQRNLNEPAAQPTAKEGSAVIRPAFRLLAVWMGMLFGAGLAFPLCAQAQADAVPVGAPVQIPLHSKAAIVMDAATGRILFEHNAHEPLPPASVTKVMTLIMALEAVQEGRVGMDDLVAASPRAVSMGGSQIWLEIGEQMSFRDLLWAIAVGSANDAAVAVAEHLAGSEEDFARLMNERARQLGARSTRLSNASGLPPADLGIDEPHVMSAYDIAVLCRHAIGLPGFLEMVGTWGPVTMRPHTQARPILWNYNRMLRSYPGMDGIKTGMTREAGYSLAATALRNHVRIIAVSLGAESLDARTQDMRRLLDYGFSRLRAVQVTKAGEAYGQAPVRRGEEPSVDLVAEEDVYTTTLREHDDKPAVAVRIDGPVEAPVAAGQRLGTLVVRVDGEVVQEIPLTAAREVPRGRFGRLWLRHSRQLLEMIWPSAD